MNLRRQAFLFIVPIFAGLALVTSGFTYYRTTHTLLAGLRAEAGAVAVSTAVFLRTHDTQELKAGRAETTPLPTALRRMERWNLVTRLCVWDVANPRAVFTHPPGADLPPPTPAMRDLLKEEPFTCTPILTDATGGSTIVGYAPLLDGAGAITAIVGAEIDATLFARARTAITRLLIRNSVIIVGIGLALAWLLAAFLGREIQRATAVAAGLSARNAPSFPPSPIREIADLGNTLGVLGAIAAETQARSERAFAENERFRTEQDLVALYRAEFCQRQAGRAAGLDATLIPIGGRAGVFRHLSAAPGRGWACFGRIDGPDTLATASLVSAAGRELAERLAGGDPPAAALAGLAALFPGCSATVVTWSDGDRRLARADLAAGVVTPSSVEAPVGETPRCVHDLPARDGVAIDLYLGQFAGEPSEKKLAELARLATGASPTGSTLLLLERPR